MKVQFGDLKNDVPVELARYIRNHMVEASRIKYLQCLGGKSSKGSHQKYQGLILCYIYL